MAKKKNNTFWKTAVASGIVLMLLSLGIYYKLNTGFLGEVHSEIFGVGVGLLAIGIIWKLFKIKLA